MAEQTPQADPDVEIKLLVTEDEFQALERMAQELKLPAQRVLRDALTCRVLIHHLLSDGCTILYQTLDGVTGEIGF